MPVVMMLLRDLHPSHIRVLLLSELELQEKHTRAYHFSNRDGSPGPRDMSMRRTLPGEVWAAQGGCAVAFGAAAAAAAAARVKPA